MQSCRRQETDEIDRKLYFTGDISILSLSTAIKPHTDNTRKLFTGPSTVIHQLLTVIDAHRSEKTSNSAD